MTKAIDPRIEQILNQVEVYQRIALEDYGVPQWQALPPASDPDIAFRPSCSQLGAVWHSDDTTTWVWQGPSQVIYATPGHIQPTTDVLLELQAAGVCLTGSHAEDVPLVPTDEVFAKFKQQASGAVAVIPAPVEQMELQAQPLPPVQTTAAVTAGNPWSYVALILVSGAVLLGFGWSVFRLDKPPQSRHRKTVVRQPSSPPQKPPPPAVEDYDFRL